MCDSTLCGDTEQRYPHDQESHWASHPLEFSGRVEGDGGGMVLQRGTIQSYVCTSGQHGDFDLSTKSRVFRVLL